MAQSTTNLGKIHVFPSEALYNQFKDIIADNDLALLKDDGAYIVAALLEQNGYVKFSNGLILQWGVAYGIQQWGKSLTAESKASVTFPIAFERIVYFVDVFSLEAGRPCLFTKSHPITTNGFYWEYNYHGDDVGVQWLAIGV